MRSTRPTRPAPPPPRPARPSASPRPQPFSPFNPSARRSLPGAGHRGHRRPGRAVQPGLERDRRRPEQHLPAVAAAAGTGHRRHRRDGPAAGRGGGREDAVRQLRGGRAVLGRARPAMFRYDVADRQQRRGDGVRRGEIGGPGDDHRLPVGGGQRHPGLAAGRGRPADHRAGQRHLLPLPGAGGHPGRDLAGLAGTDPQARHPDHRGHAVDGGGLRGRHRADRAACRVHRGRDHRLQRRHAGAQHRVLQAARPGQQQLPAGAAG